jgi:ribose-phosphate pyrophosphokinase
MEKKRSEGRVSGDAFAGDVDGATVIVIDDLISGGTTMARAARACMGRGASRVYCAATHAVFSRDTPATLGIPELESVVVTDTVALAPAQREALGAKLVILDSVALFADGLQRMFLER